MKVIILENLEIENGVSEKTELSEGVIAVIEMTGRQFENLLNCPIEERNKEIKIILEIYETENHFLDGLS